MGDKWEMLEAVGVKWVFSRLPTCHGSNSNPPIYPSYPSMHAFSFFPLTFTHPNPLPSPTRVSPTGRCVSRPHPHHHPPSNLAENK